MSYSVTLVELCLGPIYTCKKTSEGAPALYNNAALAIAPQQTSLYRSVAYPEEA